MNAPELPKPWMHDLWAHLHNEHGLTLLESEIYEIVRLADPGWQHIETAPKDGTWILVTCGGQKVPAVVFWSSDFDVWIENEEAPASWAHPEEWPLTHWMPLPTPPTK